MPILLQISTGLDLQYFKFEETSNPVFAGVFFGIVTIALAYSIYYYVTRSARMREQSLAREEARLRLLLTEFNLDEHDRETLEVLAGSDVAMDLIPLITLRTAFEQAAEKFREANPDHASVKRIPQLRQRLGYGFGNLRNSFTSTRMLPPGLRMQCTIPHGKRQVQFVTTLLGVGEQAFFVRPPTVKGKAVNLSRVPSLTFSVSRENDAGYEFSARVLGQAHTGTNAVALEHSHAIRKLLFRHTPRVTTMAIDVHFFVIKQEVAAERQHRAFKRHESQYSILGRVEDLSLGGLRMVCELPGQKPVEGDIIVFQFPPANIKDDLVAEIIEATSPKPNWIELRLQFIGMKEINRLRLSKFLQDQREAREQAGAAAAAQAGTPAGAESPSPAP
jgi:hypothetical protein